MYSPLNIIKIYDQAVNPDQHYTDYTTVFKEKYNISSEILNLIDLISLEDILAFKLEKSLNMFHGKMSFPLKQLYLDLIDVAYDNVIDAYEDKKKRREIRRCINGKKHIVASRKSKNTNVQHKNL